MEYIIFSDIDGTFMNHEDYSFECLKKFVNKLKKNYKIIFNSSKTFSEIKKINFELKIKFPFIIENGACIFFPKCYPIDKKKINSLIQYEDYFGVSLTKQTTDSWYRLLSDLRKKHSFKFYFFREISDSILQKLTNLSLQKLKYAKNRLFSEPLYWYDSEDKVSEFKKYVELEDGFINLGGRFIHVTDGYNKGLAIKEFLNLTTIDNNFTTLSLGDSENDLSMFEQTDFNFLIKSKKKKKLDLKNIKNLYHSKYIAPKGWEESINYFIEKEKYNF